MTTLPLHLNASLREEYKSRGWWRRHLLHGQSARDCLRLVGGHPSKLVLTLKPDPPEMRVPVPWDPDPSGEVPLDPEPAWEDPFDPKLYGGECLVPEPPVLDLELVEEKHTSPFFSPGALWVRLQIDPDPRTRTDHASICLESLLASTWLNDEFYIFNCDCGSPGCAGINAGVNVVHEDGLVVWAMRGSKPRRIVVFDHAQYRWEIFTQVRTALSLLKALGPESFLFTVYADRERTEQALHRAEALAVNPSTTN
jgi:hypothetical protein